MGPLRGKRKHRDMEDTHIFLVGAFVVSRAANQMFPALPIGFIAMCGPWSNVFGPHIAMCGPWFKLWNRKKLVSSRTKPAARTDGSDLRPDRATTRPAAAASLGRPLRPQWPGSDGRTDYQTRCCCFARPAPAARPRGRLAGLTTSSPAPSSYLQPTPPAVVPI